MGQKDRLNQMEGLFLLVAMFLSHSGYFMLLAAVALSFAFSENSLVGLIQLFLLFGVPIIYFGPLAGVLAALALSIPTLAIFGLGGLVKEWLEKRRQRVER